MDSGGMSSRAIDSMKKRMRREDAPRDETPRKDTPREKQAGAADLEGLLRHPALWRAGRLDAGVETVPSGYDLLDHHLGGGWPRAGLAELLIPTAGVGELRLLLPLLRTLCREQARWVAWVDPPFVPYAPALEAAGVDVGRMLLIHGRDHGETLWALERASRSGNCSLALAWLDERHLGAADTRRLQVAAHRGGTLTTLFRPDTAAATASMAALRLRLRRAAAESSLTVDVLKRRGGWPVEGLTMSLGAPVTPADVQAGLERWRRRQPPLQPALEPGLHERRHGSFGARPEPSPDAPPVWRVH